MMFCAEQQMQLPIIFFKTVKNKSVNFTLIRKTSRLQVNIDFQESVFRGSKQASQYKTFLLGPCRSILNCFSISAVKGFHSTLFYAYFIRCSVVGLSLDFLYLNFLGFICYAVFTMFLLISLSSL